MPDMEIAKRNLDRQIILIKRKRPSKTSRNTTTRQNDARTLFELKYARAK